MAYWIIAAIFGAFWLHYELTDPNGRLYHTKVRRERK